MSPPDDLIELGRVSGAYGLKGWIAVVPASDDPSVLLKSRDWWFSELIKPEKGQGPAARMATGKNAEPAIRFSNFEVISVKSHSAKLVVHLMGVEERDLAEAFKGRRVYVSRSKFPKAAEGEYYWVDLEGCKVVNQQGVILGNVDRVVDHGAHPILEVGLHLIPFVEAYVLDVNLAERSILVDWQEDY